MSEDPEAIALMALAATQLGDHRRVVGDAHVTLMRSLKALVHERLGFDVHVEEKTDPSQATAWISFSDKTGTRKRAVVAFDGERYVVAAASHFSQIDWKSSTPVGVVFDPSVPGFRGTKVDEFHARLEGQPPRWRSPLAAILEVVVKIFGVDTSTVADGVSGGSE